MDVDLITRRTFNNQVDTSPQQHHFSQDELWAWIIGAFGAGQLFGFVLAVMVLR